ncbi:SPFH domain-containing protein [Myroides odoratimimus]|uniref:SPFH domain-containing protein n=1 Tax=Myroides odoratimimus TaxID=76832 RepID=UPI002575EF29|nr:SPFH domain-containing protein [Myroides odoratimimus]MDM1327529.1 SPFH domain-containing protein [Myroides odoratimimus]
MGLFNIFKKQLASVIEWKDQPQDVVWYQFPSPTDEIKNASKLIVAPSQGCVLVYDGKVQDILLEEGTFSLSTANHPFITTLINIRQNFESEHKLKVFFFRQSQIINQSWGTPSAIKYVDKHYDIPIELGVNGTFSFKIQDINFLYREVISNANVYTAMDLKDILIQRIPQAITTYLSGASFGYTEIDAQLEVISTEIKNKLNEEFAALGLALTDFKVLGTVFDTKTQQRIATVSNITSDVKAAEAAGMTYAELEKLKALRDAARNEGGLAGAGVQMGAGLELGKQLGIASNQVLEQSGDDVLQVLKKLNLLLQEGIITQEDYDQKKKEILSKL